MESNMKNVKISEKHHDMLKSYCNKHGLKIYKVLEKHIEDLTRSKEENKTKKKDIYGDD
mgnify:CR=1 FL=1